ncbi:MAG: UDP-N-acetylmuramoyl-L-alanyl-D-glutamate--2,6-diaminopimelate ligase [Parvularculaceae bacterium]
MSKPVKLSCLIRHEFDTDPEITGLTADSREVKVGYIFAALPGFVTDGAKYIQQAEQAGAAAILGPIGTKANIPLIEVVEPRLVLAQIAAKFHAGQPAFIAGITGTNGKTSIARFAQQLWNMLDLKAGSLGTLGAFADGYEYKLRHTTPDPVEIHQVLSTMATFDISHLAMEVSSHGLAQYRADGVRFSSAAFTNITQDHLDFHDSFEDYLNAKLRLFTELLPERGVAVVNVDGADASKVVSAIKQAGRRVFSVGLSGQDLKLIKSTPQPTGLTMKVQAGELVFDLDMPLFGSFQAENALVAAGLIITSGYDAAEVLPLLEQLKGAPGRMELVAKRRFKKGDTGIYVDYAHTPDAIATALTAIRPHASGDVHIVFGAGGDRDKTKRPLMGKAALDHADHLIVTDDNPRSEDAASIRAQILATCPGAKEIGDRAEAIKASIAALKAGDVLVIAGKGHELGQTVGTLTIPFDDAQEARKIVSELG